MRDKWMNIGFEVDELLPYREPPVDSEDHGRIRKLAPPTRVVNQIVIKIGHPIRG